MRPELLEAPAVYMPSLAAGQEFPERRPVQMPEVWFFPLPQGSIWDEFTEQMPRFTITYNTVFNRQRFTRYLVNGKHRDDAGVHFQYMQELIELNRDERTAKLAANKS
jgi:hypothetical protein